MKKETEEVKVFITKYALSKGVLVCDGYITQNGMFVGQPKGWFRPDYFMKSDFFLTIVEANKDAEQRRLKKLESLKKQIQRLEDMCF